MKKRLTQRYPFLLPIRKKQRKFLFYLKMNLDLNRYSNKKNENYLQYIQSVANSKLLNHNTGFDLQYQKNKVFNLLLATKPLEYLLIYPNETFSLWKCIQYADKVNRYKDGLVVVDGKTVVTNGGGLCQLSNTLFDLFLHSPLTIIERHGHRIKHFPDTSSIKGIDATISEGWLDLKVRNDTNRTFQIGIEFSDEEMIISLYIDKPINYAYEIVNENLSYKKVNACLIEEVDLVKLTIDTQLNQIISRKKMYTNQCILDYEVEDEVSRKVINI